MNYKQQAEGINDFSKFRREQAIRYVVNDILQGATYSVLQEKLAEDGYGIDYCYKQSSRNRIIADARKRIKEDFKEQLPHLKEDMMARLLDVYTECRDLGDRGNALKALEQIAKITGMNEQKINVEGKIDNNITIDFGFDNDDKE